MTAQSLFPDESTLVANPSGTDAARSGLAKAPARVRMPYRKQAELRARYRESVLVPGHRARIVQGQD